MTTWNVRKFVFGKALILSANDKLFLFQAENTISLHAPVYKSNYIFTAMKKGK